MADQTIHSILADHVEMGGADCRNGRFHSSTRPPENPTEGAWWWHSSRNMLFVFDGTIWAAAWESIHEFTGAGMADITLPYSFVTDSVKFFVANSFWSPGMGYYSEVDNEIVRPAVPVAAMPCTIYYRQRIA